MAALEASMPCLWPEELQDLLPRDARVTLQTQKTNLRRQWGIFSKVFPEVPQQEFQHAWMLVNSRSFLDGTPETDNYPWEDRLALVPVADLFNHSEAGSRVQATSEGGYLVTTDKAYKKGEEVFITYGSHPNDYMLVEYGFILDHNKHDEVHLDDIIMPKLDEGQRVELENGRKPLFI
ncbi:Ribosomal N-lysine methyltransferase set11 [Escovopsis weberi]|uniref:Ribosomal N-lysine methyltransferase set11 n=1 Tax=Escovopsis weberi TaxID=150374 RepID=A0A0M8N0W9_ESCWE|nr:Ribosomal N-lysine methyltransferase set11 [Escovopsis weberi]